MFTSSIKREIRTLHFAVVQLQIEMEKKMRDARAKFLFCQSRLSRVSFSWSSWF